MQDSRSDDSFYGDRIFKELVNETPTDSNQARSSSQLEETPETRSYDENRNLLPITKSASIESTLNEQKLDLILDVLDRQVGTLNKLRQPNLEKLDETGTTCERSISKNGCKAAPQRKKADSLSSISSRKSFLDNYVRNKISDDGNCSCHYQFGANELELLNELNECYRKFCQFNCESLASSATRELDEEQQTQAQAQTQQVSEASDFTGCEGELSCTHTDRVDGLHLCDEIDTSESACFIESGELRQSENKRPRTRRRQQQRRRRARRRKSRLTHSPDLNEQKCSSLFIARGSSKSCHESELSATSEASGQPDCGRTQLTFGESESQPPGRPAWGAPICCVKDETFESGAAGWNNQATEEPPGRSCKCRGENENEYYLRPASENSSLHLNERRQSSPECGGHESALIGVEDSHICDLDFVEKSAPELGKRKSRLPRAARKLHRGALSSSLETSSTNCSNYSDYQLGCSLTYDSATSLSNQSARQFSPVDCAIGCDETLEGSCSIESNNARQLAVGDESERAILSRRAEGPSDELPPPHFTSARNSFRSSENCANYEKANDETLDYKRPAPPGDERDLGPDSSPLHDSWAPNEPLKLATSCAIKTMESDEQENNENRKKTSATRKQQLKKGAGGAPSVKASRSLAQANGPRSQAAESGKKCAVNRDRKRDNSTAKSPLTDERHHPADDDARGLTLERGAGAGNTTRLQQERAELQARKQTREQGPSNRGVRKLEADKDAPVASMKAAKNIAKLSYPSLSSLQYLPGQLDVRGSRFIDRMAARKKSPKMPDASEEARVECLESSARVKAEPPAGSSSGSSSKRARPGEEKGSTKHDDSCLFHRLCLCNCLARTHSQSKRLKDGADQESAEGEILLSPASPLSAARERSSSASSSTKSRNKTKARENSDDKPARVSQAASSSGKGSESSEPLRREKSPSVERDVTRRAPDSSESGGRKLWSPFASCKDEPARKEGGEKQSPSFKSLLQRGEGRPATLECAGAYKADRYDKLRSMAQRPKNFSRGQHHGFTTTAAIHSDGLGSIGDLAASGRSSASDSLTTECSTSKGYKSTSPEFLERHASSTEILTDDRYQANVFPSDKIGAKSVFSCSNPAHRNRHVKKLPTYKRLLSPKKLFTTSASNVCDCGEKQEELHQPSFLTRSLSRLSGRNKARNRMPSPPCASPSSSMLNDQATDAYSDSINSLEEINLTHSLPPNIEEKVINGKNYHANNTRRLKRAPDIVLSRVEFQDVDSDCSIEMARSSGGGINSPSYRPSSAQSCQNYPRTNSNLEQPRRQGSELSYGRNDSSGSFDGLHRASSLPASPPQRRRNLSGSSRLSQSPVPFHSPASESTKIEDGLKVCSLEHFEKHIGNLKEDQTEVQKKLFTSWINYIVPNLIRNDLFDELQDGIKLIGLLAALTHDRELQRRYEDLRFSKQSYTNKVFTSPSSKMQHASNVTIAVEYLRKQLSMKLVNLNVMDIVSGKANVILGLCWTIILRFQMDHDFIRSSDSSSNHSSKISRSTSRISDDRFSDDGARSHGGKFEELTPEDMGKVRNRLLEHINKRFKMKLTNLSSSLLDADVLLAIIKHLLPKGVKIDPEGETFNGRAWSQLSDDERLDYSFQLAKDHLKVPQLLSASELRRQTISENNPKAMLIYLSMVLKASARDCSTEQVLELRELEEPLKNVLKNHQPSKGSEAIDDVNSKIKQLLASVDTEGKFHVERLQSTLTKIKEIGDIIEGRNGKLEVKIDQKIVDHYSELKKQADQVEFLIDWINKAEKLFSEKPRSASNLESLIQEYGFFFSASKLPKANLSLCPNLERQHRECLATAKQRVILMQQARKNWLDYDRAEGELKNWLKQAESKLKEALRPSHNCEDPSEGKSSSASLHSDRLDDVIEFFELDLADMNDVDDYTQSFAPSSSPLGLLGSSFGMDRSNRSLSESLISLGSTGSHVSASAGTKTTTYHRLFSDYEIKCKLLGAILEPEQRDELMEGIKEVKAKLKQTTEFYVPQVIRELRMKMVRCQMAIQEQDETCSDAELCDSQPAENVEGEMDEIEAPHQDISASSGSNIRDSCTKILAQTQQVGATKQINDGGSVKSTCQKRKIKTRPRSHIKSPFNKGKKYPIIKASMRFPTQASPDDDGEEMLPYLKRFWRKIVRASKISLSFNIVLLICMAGICMVPLLQRDACCELNQPPIPKDGFDIDPRPT